ncbi:MlaD family protein [Wenxinia saemankumensis]|uniref:Paraquat-inducible protein B n=1 Tax=Wenxinia saemankumensis TaxID=1447782 RepID=A0A1M6A8Q7_9RHOB|nr:MlaD family protein [Wenxinia saemankumensis]SHI32829.1 Paraquat-inducible protein B [Wenxinia saemankumensis]
MSDETTLPPRATVEPRRRSLWQRISIVWLVPLAALVIALGVAWQNYADRGPLITVYFDEAAGVHARETELRYRDVAVGEVEGVAFTADLDRVAVEIRLDKDVAPYVDEGAEFWVVQPEVTTQGITGLDTVLTGVYIQGEWDGQPGEQTYEFDGLFSAPLLTGSQAGLRIELSSTGDALTGNTPLLYKGVEVGWVGAAEVSVDGFRVEAPAVIYAPYDALVTEETRFWDTSGFSFSVGTGGASVNFESLSSLIVGGVTFETFVSGAPLAEDSAEFTIYPDAETARASVFSRNAGPPLELVAIFDGNVSGLSVGAAVELEGLRIGQISAINGVVEEGENAAEQVKLQAVLSIQPARLGFDGIGGREDALDYIAAQVEQGLRARLATGNILTGGLKVQLVEDAPAGEAALDLTAAPYPELPTTDSDIVDVSNSAQDTLDRINNLPIEEILASARSLLDNTARLVGNDATQALPGELAAILADLRAVTSADGIQAAPDRVAEILGSLSEATGEVAGLLAQIDAAGLVGSASETVEAARGTLTELQTALTGVPALIEEATGVAATANGLELQAVVDSAQDALDNLSALLGSEAIQGVPGQVQGILANVDALAGDPALQDAPEQVAAILSDLAGSTAEVERILGEIEARAITAQVGEVLTAAETTLASIDAAVADVPGLIGDVRALPLGSAVSEIEAAVANLNAVLGSEAIQGVPGQVQGILADVRGITGDAALQGAPEQVSAILADLQGSAAEVSDILAAVEEQALVERIGTAVDGVSAAVANVDTALAGLPGLLDETEGLVAEARALPLDVLVARVSTLAGSADALLSSEGTQALPGQLNATLATLDTALSEVQRAVATVNEGQGAERLLAAIDDAGAAAEAARSAVEGVPGVIERIDAVAANAQAADLAGVTAQAQATLASAQALLSNQGTQDLPGELGAAVTELRGVLADLREGGAVDNVNAALVSARNAADQLSVAVQGLPGLIDRTGSFVVSTGDTVAAYGENGTLARELRQTLREVAQAAETLSSLAREIERRPNSLILGR